jgi:hypothetical protein
VPGVGVYVAPDGTPTLFGQESVSEVVAVDISQGTKNR